MIGIYPKHIPDQNDWKDILSNPKMDFPEEAYQALILEAQVAVLRQKLKIGEIDLERFGPHQDFMVRYQQFLRGPPPNASPRKFNDSPQRKSSPRNSNGSTSPPGVIKIYTDGSCTNNGNGEAKAGYGVHFQDYPHLDEKGRVLGELQTNNRGELTAVIRALEIYQEKFQGKKAILYSDSKYFTDAIKKGWLSAWKKRGWKKADGDPVKNQDLWELIDPLLSSYVQIEWVKGHADSAGNNRADTLARLTT